jgi:hypothetical protein
MLSPAQEYLPVADGWRSEALLFNWILRNALELLSHLQPDRATGS